MTLWRIYAKAPKGGASDEFRAVRADRLVVTENGCLSFFRGDTPFLVIPFGQYARCEWESAEQ